MQTTDDLIVSYSPLSKNNISEVFAGSAIY